MKDCQAYIDKMQQAILDNALSNARNRAIFNDQTGINEKEFSDPSCTLVHANGNLGENAYRPLEGKPLNGIYVTVLNNKIQELKDTIIAGAGILRDQCIRYCIIAGSSWKTCKGFQ